MSSGAEITTATFHLTSAQVLALFSSPVQLVAPQGLKKVIVPIFCVLRYNFVTTAYTVSSLNFFLGYTPSLPALGIFSVSPANALTGAVSRELLFTPGSFNFFDTVANVENQGLSIAVSSPNPTLGDATLDLVLGYQIVTMP